jgi:hypothetical protein
MIIVMCHAIYITCLALPPLWQSICAFPQTAQIHSNTNASYSHVTESRTTSNTFVHQFLILPSASWPLLRATSSIPISITSARRFLVDSTAPTDMPHARHPMGCAPWDFIQFPWVIPKKEWTGIGSSYREQREQRGESHAGISMVEIGST